MKEIRNLLVGVFVGGGLIVGLHLLHAQETAMPVQGGAISTVDWNTASDLQVMLQAVEMMPEVSADSLPRSGTFYSAQHAPGSAQPWPPLPSGFGLPAWNLGDGFYLLDDQAVDYSLSISSGMAGGRTMMMDEGGGMLPPGGGGGDGTNEMYSDSFNYTLPTNGLWLTITNVSGGLAYLNLHGATNFVYEIFSRTNLADASGWSIETEVFPTDTNSMPFNIPVLDRTSALFVWARDWTGVTSGGNQTPEWWFWKNFGTVNLSDSMLDTQGNTLLYDYTNHLDPNVIQFTIEVLNNYVNTRYPSLQMNVTAGTPGYYTVLVNDTNAADAVWLPYTSSNIVATLGTTDGVYNVIIGLCGSPAGATQTWQETTLTKDTNPTRLVITNLASRTGSRPFIDPAGYSTKALSSLTFDVTNAAGAVSHDQGSVVDQDLVPADMNHTTNWFVCQDMALTMGTNYVGIHAVDWAGNVTATNFSYIFNTNGDTTPPVIGLTWPQSGMEISGNSFTLRGTMDDDTATVSGQWTDTNGVTQTVTGLVERGGQFWLQNLPLNPGTNLITVTATDAAGNAASTSLTLVQSGVTLMMDQVSVSQLNQVCVSVSGEMSDPDYVVWVNGVEVTNYDEYGDWWADNVPVTAGGTASFDMTAYPPGYAPSGNSWTNFAVEEAAYPNPLPADPVQGNADWDKPAVVYVKKMKEDFSGYDLPLNIPAESSTTSASWSQGDGGLLHSFSAYWEDYSNVVDQVWPEDAGLVPVLPSHYQRVRYHDGVPISTYTTDQSAGFGYFESITGSGVYANLQDYYRVPPTWSGNIGYVVELFTGGKALRQSKALFVLSDALTWCTGALHLEVDQNYPVPSPEIALGALGNLGNDGILYVALNTSEHVVITPRASHPYLNGSLPTEGKYTLVHLTEYLALTDTNPARLNLGVGEKVDLSGMPAETVWQGPGLLATNSAVTFTAPSNACTATVTATFKDAEPLQVSFAVKEPSGVDQAHTYIIETNFPPISGLQGGQAAAGMHLHVVMAPTDVSFYRVMMEEVGEDATTITGYFTNAYLFTTNPASFLRHATADTPFNLNENNMWDRDTANQSYDYCLTFYPGGFGFPPTPLGGYWFPGGSFTWNIPWNWWITGSSHTNYVANGWQQIFAVDPYGTVKITKFDSKWVQRTTSGVITNSP